MQQSPSRKANRFPHFTATENSLSNAEPELSNPHPQPISYRLILILSSHLLLSHPSGFLPHVSPPKPCMHQVQHQMFSNIPVTVSVMNAHIHLWSELQTVTACTLVLTEHDTALTDKITYHVS